MREIKIVQRNYDGQGNDRTFRFWRKADEVDTFVERKSRAFNMARTTITVR
jgi:hypothetical protein